MTSSLWMVALLEADAFRVFTSAAAQCDSRFVFAVCQSQTCSFPRLFLAVPCPLPQQEIVIVQPSAHRWVMNRSNASVYVSAQTVQIKDITISEVTLSNVFSGPVQHQSDWNRTESVSCHQMDVSRQLCFCKSSQI